MKKFISIVSEVLLKRPLVSLVFFLVLLYFAFIQSLKLKINSNQIDLLPPEYPEVIKTKKVIEMIGGNGFFIVVLKLLDEKGMNEHLKKAYLAKNSGNLKKFEEEFQKAKQIQEQYKDYYLEKEKLLKSTADELNQILLQEEDILYISYKYDTTFLQERISLFLKPEDLLEIRNRIQKKIEYEKEKLNPFRINLEEEDYNPDFSDILDKYKTLAKRDIFDDYNISPDKTMLIMLIKPTGSFVDVNFTKSFEAKIEKIIEENKIRDRGLYVGYTGTYKLNLDDYESIVNALRPISIASLVGIILLLLIFFRNPIFIIILTISLVSGVIFTFGIASYTLGELNTITSILAAVLMGLGIDYGIQFLYRFQEELTLRGDFLYAVKETIYHTGLASLTSAFTTTSAFFVLMFSEFRGFSEFGFIASYGIVTIALCMYFITAIQIGILFEFFPKSKKFFQTKPLQEIEVSFVHKIFSNPNKVLYSSLAVVFILSIFSFSVEFNYSGRDLLLENQDSLLLYDEIGNRFGISSDPQVIVTESFEETEAIFDYFSPLNEKLSKVLDQVVGVWSFIPPPHQQKYNLYLLKKIQEDLKQIPLSMLSKEQKTYLPIVNKLLSVKEFSLEDVPSIFTKPFKEIPTSKEKGFLLFVYPKIALWHGKDLLEFYDIVGHFNYPIISKRTINQILYAHEVDLEKIDNPQNHNELKYTPEELEIILNRMNTFSEQDFLKAGVLPLTVKFIIEHRPYNSLEDIRKHQNQAGTVGSVILFAKLAQIVQSEALIAVVFTLLIVLFILIFFYRGFLPAVLSLVPLILGMFSMIGIMGLTGLKINFMNILVFPIIIGYGIQNGIYIYYRYMEEREIARTLLRVGPAIIASTLTTLVGWAVLLIAEHRGLHSIGMAASIGISTTLIVAIVVMPVLLEKFYEEKNEVYENETVSHGINFDEPKLSEDQEVVLDELTTKETNVKKKISKKKISKKQSLKTKKTHAKKKSL